MTKLTGADVASHNSRKSAWMILHGRAYDLTDFLNKHPGGSGILLKNAGGDGTAEFSKVHPPDIIDRFLKPDQCLGEVDMETVEKVEEELDEEEKERRERVKSMPSLSECFNLWDFEAMARHVMPHAAWAYYSSGADDELTMRENQDVFRRVWFRPRILRDVSVVDTTTTMLGRSFSSLFYVTATALGKLGHPDGETCLTRAAAKQKVAQMIPTLASCTFDEIVDARMDGQTQWLQLYVNPDREFTKKIIEHAEARGCQGLFVTVDAPMIGRREKDMRTKFADRGADLQQEADGAGQVDRSQGASRAISSFIDPSLCWADIPWIQSITKMPIIIKGVQRVDDIIRAADAGLQGVVISNHGGRQLDTAPSGLEVLAEAYPELSRRGLLFRSRTPEGRTREGMFDIFVDGGVRRGTDIIKAICLGATGVGIGRPFLYAMSSYGEAGVVRAMEMLQYEIEMNMRCLGAASVAELTPDMVDARGLMNGHVGPGPANTLAGRVYEGLRGPVRAPGSRL